MSFEDAYADLRAPEGQESEGGRVAYDADHGRRGERPARPAALRLAARDRADARLPEARARLRRQRPVLSFALALVAIAVHSLFYNALFEDPDLGVSWRWSPSRRAPTSRRASSPRDLKAASMHV